MAAGRHLLDERAQAPGVERLGEVLVHAGREATLPVALHRMGGHGDDRQTRGAALGLGRANRRRRLEAAHLGHLDVHQRDVERLCADGGERLAAVGGDRALLAEISRLFVEDAPRHLQKIREALDARDGESLRRAAHGLKGAAANFDADGVVNAARELEEIGRSGEPDAQDAAWNSLTAEMEQLVTLLRTVSH